MEAKKSQQFYFQQILALDELPDLAGKIVLPANLHTQSKGSKPYFLAVVDSSGSMSSCWKDLAATYNAFVEELKSRLGIENSSNQIQTFCFDASIHPVPTNLLDTSIYAHGGGMTNIVEAMRQMETRIDSIPSDSPVFVVFISDGDDTCNGGLDSMMNKLNQLRGNTGRKEFNFMCVGVGSGFPTRVSMYLRERYHRGNDAVPSIFCIEYISEKAFKNKLDGVLEFCQVRNFVELDSGVLAVPWEGERKFAVEKTWVVTRSPVLRMGRQGVALVTDKEKFNSLTVERESKPEDFSIEAVADIFRSWSQKLQLDSITKSITQVQAQEYSCSTYNLMLNILEDIKNSRGIEILNAHEEKSGESFLESVLRLQVSRVGMRIRGYVTAVEEIKNGKDLSKLDQFEAAKIIGLGTITGKAQQRANALKNMTQATLKDYIEEFLSAVEKLKVKNETGFEVCKITNRSLHTLLKDTTLASGLRKIRSPLDFLETFPLFGIGLQLKRNEGTLDSAQKAAVKSYTNDLIDSSTFDFATLSLTIGEQTYNSLCPLIPMTDAYTAPLFSTNLMKYLISYNVTEQLDKINDNSWLVILGDLFVLSYKAEDFATVEKILDTIEALKVCDSAVKGWIEAIEMEDLSQYSTFPRKSIFILLHYYVMKRSAAAEERLSIMQKIWLRYFEYRLKQTSVSDFVITEKMSNLKSVAEQIHTDDFILKKFYTSKEIVRYCAKELVQDLKKLEVSSGSDALKLNPSFFTSDVNKDISFKFVKSIHKEFLPQVEVSEHQMMIYLSHCTSNKGKIFSTQVGTNLDEVIKSLASQNNSGDTKHYKKMAFSFTDKLKRRYMKLFKSSHWGIETKPWDEIVKICEQKGIDASKLEYNATSQMIANACMSDNCPHQFVPQSKRKFLNHLGGWQGMCPRSFHLFVASNKTKSTEDIFSSYMASKGQTDPEEYCGVSKDKIIQYIELVKNSLHQICNNQLSAQLLIRQNFLRNVLC